MHISLLQSRQRQAAWFDLRMYRGLGGVHTPEFHPLFFFVLRSERKKKKSFLSHLLSRGFALLLFFFTFSTFFCLCSLVVVLLLQVDTTEVPDFTTMYELYDPVTVMFFYRQVELRKNLQELVKKIFFPPIQSKQLRTEIYGFFLMEWSEMLCLSIHRYNRSSYLAVCVSIRRDTLAVHI